MVTSIISRPASSDVVIVKCCLLTQRLLLDFVCGSKPVSLPWLLEPKRRRPCKTPHQVLVRGAWSSLVIDTASRLEEDPEDPVVTLCLQIRISSQTLSCLTSLFFPLLRYRQCSLLEGPMSLFAKSKYGVTRQATFVEAVRNHVPGIYPPKPFNSATSQIFSDTVQVER